ncbi:hypothetical protein BP6252_10105 [Coleophoma cylindrospora]|uniref:Uncharacterized protein n=1 Tax=Coleophoma cylindrospora TaxID=1849047 RepID=A0A3D8QXQ1_9HELO|nr:hypothetical protein BP6252_10105 [Coleophoma cylindrospora]
MKKSTPISTDQQATLDWHIDKPTANPTYSCQGRQYGSCRSRPDEIFRRNQESIDKIDFGFTTSSNPTSPQRREEESDDPLYTFAFVHSKNVTLQRARTFSALTGDPPPARTKSKRRTPRYKYIPDVTKNEDTGYGNSDTKRLWPGPIHSIINIDPNNTKRVGKDPQTKWTRLKQHTRRYWYWYLLGLVLFLALFLVLIFIVIIPVIIQRIVNDTKLPIHSAILLNPHPNSVQMSINSSIKIAKGFSARLNPMNLSLTRPGSTIAYTQVSLPELHIKGNTTISVQNQTTPVMNMTAWVEFLQSAVYSDQFALAVRGQTNAYLGKIRAHVSLNKNVELRGLNKLNGFSLATTQLVVPSDPDGTNLLGTAIIPNHSVVSFEMGNLTLNLMLGGIVVGSASINDVFISPGNNTVPIRASVEFSKVLANARTILASQASSIKEGYITIQASGNSTVYNGEHIYYYEQVLNPLNITVMLPLKTLLVGILQGLGNTSNVLDSRYDNDSVRDWALTTPSLGTSKEGP